MKKVRNLLLIILHMRAFLRMEFADKNSLGLRHFFENVKNGFLSVSSVYYNFKLNDREKYLSDWARIHRASRINSRKRVVLDDKLLFHHMHRDNKYVKPIVALTKGKKMFKLVNHNFVEIDSEEEFLVFVEKFEHGLIIKPYTGGGGAGISKVSCYNNRLVFEGSCKNYADFHYQVINGKDDFLMTEIIHQTGSIHNIYPNTLNTIRILTMYDTDDNEPFIASAVQRIGTKKSLVVDNFTAGGISANIDIDEGIIGKGAYKSSDKGRLIWCDSHPDTGINIEGTRINNWDDIKRYILSLSRDYFYLPYIGWDVVPMEDSFFILEANSNSDVNLLQIHGGLLADPKVAAFYMRHKVIK